MDKPLRLLICSNYRAEAETILRSEGWQDVELKFYSRLCGRPLKPIETVQNDQAEYPDEENQIVLSCQSFLPGRESEDFHRLPRCFYMIVNQALVDYAIRDGRYVFTPGWLAGWAEHLTEWGMDQSSARTFFKENFRKLLLLDTGVDEQASKNLADLSVYLGLTVDTLPVGLDYMRLYLTHLVSDWRQKKHLQKIEAINVEANQISADYAMVIDLLTNLSQVRSEEEAHSEIADLFAMFFSQDNVSYYPVLDGKVVQNASHSISKDVLQFLQTWINDSEETYTLTPAGKGFYLRIEYMHLTLGVALVDGLNSPRYIQQYLNLSLMIARLCGLSISNARNFQNLQLAEKTVRIEKDLSETMRSVLTEITSELDQDEVLDQILFSLNRVIPFSLARVYLMHDGFLEFKSGLRKKSDNEFETYQPDNQYFKIDASWLGRTPLGIQDLMANTKMHSYMPMANIRSWIGLPLILRGGIIGFLSIGNLEEDVYNNETIAVAQMFGDEVTIAIENARLFKEVKEASITDSLAGLYNRRYFYE